MKKSSLPTSLFLYYFCILYRKEKLRRPQYFKIYLGIVKTIILYHLAISWLLKETSEGFRRSQWQDILKFCKNATSCHSYLFKITLK